MIMRLSRARRLSSTPLGWQAAVPVGRLRMRCRKLPAARAAGGSARAVSNRACLFGFSMPRI